MTQLGEKRDVELFTRIAKVEGEAQDVLDAAMRKRRIATAEVETFGAFTTKGEEFIVKAEEVEAISTGTAENVRKQTKLLSLGILAAAGIAIFFLVR